MSKRIELTVPQPCHENWDGMSPMEKGRFCGACQKQVVDFTGMSDEKRAAFFRDSSKQVCGRFRNDQLQKELTIPQKTIPFVRYFFHAALPAVLFSCRGYTQGEPVAKRAAPLSQQQTSTLADMEKNIPIQKAQTLTGQVTDTEGRGIRNASILRPGLSGCSATDKDGFFKLTVNEKDSLIQLEIVVSAYEKRLVEIDVHSFERIPIIRLERMEFPATEYVTMGVIAVQPAESSKKSIPQKVDTETRHFTIFPNPVASGSSLNIELANKVEEGYYHLQVTAPDGRNMFRKELWIDAEARVMNIELPAITPGHYILGLKNRNTGKVFAEKLLIR